jgi:hypothetical protein
MEEIGTVETAPRIDGRQMTMVLAPLRRQRTVESAKPRTESAVIEPDDEGETQAEEE